MLSNELGDLFGRDLSRLVQELTAFPDTASLWKTAPGVSNAAGTLALTLGHSPGQATTLRRRPRRATPHAGCARHERRAGLLPLDSLAAQHPERQRPRPRTRSRRAAALAGVRPPARRVTGCRV